LDRTQAKKGRMGQVSPDWRDGRIKAEGLNEKGKKKILWKKLGESGQKEGGGGKLLQMPGGKR